MDDDKLTLHFVHPTNPSEMLTAAVSPESTPQYLVRQMVSAGFLPEAGAVGQYKLRNAQSGVQLLDQVTLRAAGVPNNSNLLVDHTTTGAGG